MTDPAYIGTLYKMRDQYRANAEHAIAAHEYRKASELLWGAVTQELKAFAASRGFVITSHRQFFDFLRQISVELHDSQLYIEFVELNALHKNFYDEVIPEDVFPSYYQRSIDYIAHLDQTLRSLSA